MGIKISELFAVTKTIKVAGKDVELQPLTLEQIIKLLTIYREEIIMMFSDSLQGELNMVTMVATAPRMVADIIAYGLGAEDQIQDIMKLPGFTQVELLAEIWKVSIPEPKKLFSLLSEAMEGMQGAGVNASLPSQNQENIPPTLPTPTVQEQQSTTSLPTSERASPTV